MSKEYWYSAFGFLIRSDIGISEYRSAEAGTPDIVIRATDESGASATLEIQFDIAGGAIGDVIVVEGYDG